MSNPFNFICILLRVALVKLYHLLFEGKVTAEMVICNVEEIKLAIFNYTCPHHEP